MAWPFVRMHDLLLVTGFLERAIARWLRKHTSSSSVVLEIGAGPLAMGCRLHKGSCYNALDIAYSEFALRRALKPRANINPMIASATSMPIESSTVDFIISKEMFMYIPELEKALDEIHRVLKPGGKLACTIGNIRSYKYARKGISHDFANNFSFEEFKALVESRSFRCVEAFMKGYWIPFPLWLTKTTLNLPITSREEYYNTNFLYLFEAVKR